MKKQNIALLTFPMMSSGSIPLSNLINILCPLSNTLYVITGNEGYNLLKDDRRIHIYDIRHDSGKNKFSRIVKYVSTQLKISYKLAQMRNIDVWIFFIGGDTLLLPMLTAKFMRKKVILASAAYQLQMSRSQNDNLLNAIEILEHINRNLSDIIILYSQNLIKEWNFEKYKNKICIAHEHIVDLGKFEIKKMLSDRKNLIGYIGRLSEEKGVLNFIQAIPKIIKEIDNVEFLIIGEGYLGDSIKKYLDENNLNGIVSLTGWIRHDELPNYLNELKLLIIPSFTEGLPNIMLEAMACGTPVLATSVGSIPNIIKDEDTGFIMDNNSSICITKNIIKVLEYPNLYRIADNARKLVEKEFTYEIAVENYKKILEYV